MKFYKDLFTTYRESRRFSQEELAKRIGVSKQAVQQWENGTCRPRPANVYAVAETLGISVVDISDLKAEGWLKKPENPFLQIIIDNWDKLSFEDQGRLAGIVQDISKRAASSPEKSAPVVAICPKCGEKITEPHRSGDKFECPKCGQHLQAN